jgi:hypothetical protein
MPMRISLLGRSLLVLLLSLCRVTVGLALTPPEEVVRTFYETYLDNLGNPAVKPKPDMPFSVEFRNAIEEHEKVCKLYASGICGFGANGDIYLDSQEYETGLTLINSGFHVAQGADGVVTVKLNVYPSIPTKDGYYDRQVSLKFILESGAWVVDDLWYADRVSWKVRMRQENEAYLKNPDPDSVYMKRKSKPAS